MAETVILHMAAKIVQNVVMHIEVVVIVEIVGVLRPLI